MSTMTKLAINKYYIYENYQDYWLYTLLNQNLSLNYFFALQLQIGYFQTRFGYWVTPEAVSFEWGLNKKRLCNKSRLACKMPCYLGHMIWQRKWCLKCQWQVEIWFGAFARPLEVNQSPKNESNVNHMSMHHIGKIIILPEDSLNELQSHQSDNTYCFY